jgi:hypothetical protein
MNKNILKSIGAFFAGMIAVIVLSIGTDFIFSAVGIFPPIDGIVPFDPWMLAVALAYRCVFTVLGGYITAALAPARPMRLVTISGIVGIVVAIIGTIVGWDLSAHWYPIALVITALPCSLLGGKLWVSKQKNIL